MRYGSTWEEHPETELMEGGAADEEMIIPESKPKKEKKTKKKDKKDRKDKKSKKDKKDKKDKKERKDKKEKKESKEEIVIEKEKQEEAVNEDSDFEPVIYQPPIKTPSYAQHIKGTIFVTFLIICNELTLS